VTLYQNVTTGRANDRSAAYPVLSDGATVYAGATIVGGVTIGVQAVVAAHAVVRHDVPPNAVAAGVPARIVTR
jgi:serine O-acetyltransferase